jgi:hypothetical protein
MNIVLLQPMDKDPPADFKSKDKFLILAIPVSSKTVSMINESGSSDIVRSLSKEII